MSKLTTKDIDKIKEIVGDLESQVQYLVDYMDSLGLLSEGCFSFPHGVTIWATGKEPGSTHLTLL